jgi:hypothetical protein
MSGADHGTDSEHDATSNGDCSTLTHRVLSPSDIIKIDQDRYARCAKSGCL